jgi:ligand-binding sensor protein
MDLYDVRTEQKWQEILDGLWQESGMPAVLSDSENIVLQASGNRNPLCAKIRSIENSRSFICGQTQQFMAGTAASSKKPVTDLCEAGMLKSVIPLFRDNQFIGSITVCGSSVPGEEIETFAISKSTNMNEEDISRLVGSVPESSQDIIERLAVHLFDKINRHI